MTTRQQLNRLAAELTDSFYREAEKRGFDPFEFQGNVLLEFAQTVNTLLEAAEKAPATLISNTEFEDEYNG